MQLVIRLSETEVFADLFYTCVMFVVPPGVFYLVFKCTLSSRLRENGRDGDMLEDDGNYHIFVTYKELNQLLCSSCFQDLVCVITSSSLCHDCYHLERMCSSKKHHSFIHSFISSKPSISWLWSYGGSWAYSQEHWVEKFTHSEL